MPGGWEYQPYITTYDSFIFYNAIGTHDDYFYHPIAVAKQIVNGTNYRFMTIAEPKETGLTPHFAIVEIYQPLNGKAYATSITVVIKAPSWNGVFFYFARFSSSAAF